VSVDGRVLPLLVGELPSAHSALEHSAANHPNEH
ncbi:hypothetical protein D046_5716B, partial [Vibrio parahaemolyticus V-223/04]